MLVHAANPLKEISPDRRRKQDHAAYDDDTTMEDVIKGKPLPSRNALSMYNYPLLSGNALMSLHQKEALSFTGEEDSQEDEEKNISEKLLMQEANNSYNRFNNNANDEALPLQRTYAV